ncbi:MAG: 6-phosphogluconolactonase [Patescibacteria group bacterium]
MTIRKIGNLEIRIFASLEELSHHAAQFFILANQQADVFTIALSGGSTPKRMFELLATDYRKDINWSKVHIFWGDERKGKDDPANNFLATSQLLLNKVEANVHRIKLELGLVEGARDYTRQIDKWAPRGFNLALHGAGTDGHRNGILSEKPGINWKNDIWDLPESVKVWGQEVPLEVSADTLGITLTPWFLDKSKINVLMLAGSDKADLLRKITVDKDKYNKRELPAITFNESKTLILVDRAAASQL